MNQWTIATIFLGVVILGATLAIAFDVGDVKPSKEGNSLGGSKSCGSGSCGCSAESSCGSGSCKALNGGTCGCRNK